MTPRCVHPTRADAHLDVQVCVNVTHIRTGVQIRTYLPRYLARNPSALLPPPPSNNIIIPSPPPLIIFNWDRQRVQKHQLFLLFPLLGDPPEKERITRKERIGPFFFDSTHGKSLSTTP